MPIAEGSQAPDFALPSHRGEEIRLSDFLGKKHVVLFFYPKDMTPGCTKEACSFRDAFEDFAGADAEVLGISSDSPESHTQFAAKHNLQFHLLSDRGGKVRAQYGIKSTLGILPGRVTFLIDKTGVVRKVYDSQFNYLAHVNEMRGVLREMQPPA